MELEFLVKKAQKGNEEAFIEDISVKDIAKLANIPEGTVKSRLHRARSILSELFMDGRKSYAGNVK